MLKRLSTYIAILLGLACMIFGYVSFENRRFRQETLKELGPILADEQDQKNELLALGDVDLNPTGLTLATLEQRLKRAVPLGDFPSIRIREIRRGESDQKLVELWKGGGAGSPKLFRRISWDKDWTAAWAGLDGKVFELVFANDTLFDRLYK